MSTAREQILGALRAGLRDTTPSPLPPVRRGAPVPAAERADRFVAVLNRIGGRAEIVADLATATARIEALLAEHGVQRLATSDAPELAGMTPAWSHGRRVLPSDATREELLDADAGVTFAQLGIAETGTLVLATASEQNRLASLLPALHLAVLPCSRLCGSLGDAFAALVGVDGAPRSRTITFVTGPSRTADIELTLVVGVHGPKALHVLLVAGA